MQTRYRGDATRLAATAASDKFGLVMTLGGDGTVNEAVNGLLGGTAWADAPRSVHSARAAKATAAPPADDAEKPEFAAPPDAAELPALAALPGGNANVFTRTLHLPADPVDAVGRLIEDLAAGKERTIGLGTANGRYFTFNAGLGFDAEVVRAVEGRRAHGRTLTPSLYFRTALRQYYQVTDRRHPAITIAEPQELAAGPVFLCIVSNSAPWTYLGSLPVNTNPDASFETGLDLLAFLRLGTIATMRTLRQMLSERSEPPRGRSVVSGHDLPEIRLSADRPLAFQLDGEYMGEVERVRLRSVPNALRVVG